MCTAYGGAGILVGCGSHGTSVQDNQIGFTRGRDPEQSFLRQLPFHNGTVCLCGSASKTVQEELRH
jgi:hypothetical protein